MVSFAKPKSVNLRMVFLSLDVYNRFSGWGGDKEERTNELVIISTGESDLLLSAP